jgi:hypothetical protein
MSDSNSEDYPDRFDTRFGPKLSEEGNATVTRILRELEGLSWLEIKALTDLMAGDHRTHQQQFGLIVHTIINKMAWNAEHRGYDDRNAATADFVRGIKDAGLLKDRYFPRI